MLIGAPEVGLGRTFPLIRITFVGVFTAFEEIVTLLLIAPGRFVSYFTVIEAVFPGASGSFGQEGTVHPQDPFALEMIKFSAVSYTHLTLPTTTSV